MRILQVQAKKVPTRSLLTSLKLAPVTRRKDQQQFCPAAGRHRRSSLLMSLLRLQSFDSGTSSSNYPKSMAEGSTNGPSRQLISSQSVPPPPPAKKVLHRIRHLSNNMMYPLQRDSVYPVIRVRTVTHQPKTNKKKHIMIHVVKRPQARVLHNSNMKRPAHMWRRGRLVTTNRYRYLVRG